MLKVMRDPEARESRRDDMAKSAAPYIHARKVDDTDKKIEVVISFQRSAEAFRGATVELTPNLVQRLDDEPEAVRETMRLVLEGVPEDKAEGLYNRALPMIHAAAQRGEGEVPEKELVQKPEVEALAEGYMVNLDVEEEEERGKLQDVITRMEAHNRKVRERAK